MTAPDVPRTVPVAVVKSRLARWLLMGLAVLSLGVGVLGLFLPGLPTTEFVLLAAWAAARSSPRLHGWMLRHRWFGPLLAHWQAGHLPRRAKWAATFTMSLAAAMLWLHLGGRPGAWGIAALVCMALVLVWLWRRPEPGREPVPPPAVAGGEAGKETRA